MKISAAVVGLLASGALAHVGMGGAEEGNHMVTAGQPMGSVKRGGIKTDGDNINVSGHVDSNLGNFHKRDNIDPVKVNAGASVDADANVRGGVKRDGIDPVKVNAGADADVGVKGGVKRDGIDPVKVNAGADADVGVKGGVKRDGLRWAKRLDRKAKTGVARREMPVSGSQHMGQDRNRENE